MIKRGRREGASEPAEIKEGDVGVKREKQEKEGEKIRGERREREKKG